MRAVVDSLGTDAEMINIAQPQTMLNLPMSLVSISCIGELGRLFLSYSGALRQHFLSHSCTIFMSQAKAVNGLWHYARFFFF